jgi:transposase
MAKTFRPYEPDQMLLMPPSIQEWVPEGHLARFVSDLVNTLDLSAIEARYEEEERGFPPYDPRMMVKVLVYGYCTGTYSSRRIAAKLVDSVAFRFLAAGNEPDFRTISEFRRRHLGALRSLFDQVLQVCRETGLVKLGQVAVDGTKVKANASKHKAMSYGKMKQREKDLSDRVRQILEHAEAVDREEDARYGKDRRGDELPEELARAETRLKKIREAKAALEARAKEKARAEGKDPDDATPPDKAQRNFTDEESSIQKTPDGYIQGYNAQVAVDSEFQIIVAQHVTSAGPDVEEMEPAVARIEESLKAKPKVVLADAGYWSESNARLLQGKGIDAHIATKRMKHGDREEPAPRGRVPKELSLRERMARKLRTKKGRRLYAKRKTLVEPVIGQIKQARGFRQFLLRGAKKVAGEWSLICTAHNMLKLYGAMGLV